MLLRACGTRGSCCLTPVLLEGRSPQWARRCLRRRDSGLLLLLRGRSGVLGPAGGGGRRRRRRASDRSLGPAGGGGRRRRRRASDRSHRSGSNTGGGSGDGGGATRGGAAPSVPPRLRGAVRGAAAAVACGGGPGASRLRQRPLLRPPAPGLSDRLGNPPRLRSDRHGRVPAGYGRDLYRARSARRSGEAPGQGGREARTRLEDRGGGS